MEFEWIAPQNSRRGLLALSSSTPQVVQTSISSPTATDTPATTQTSDPSLSSTGSPLPLIPSVPVPIITVGKVFAPIPQGRQTILPEAMEAARHLGLAPMLAAAMGTASASPDEFWDIASLTDPLTASNLMQVSALGQRRLLFVERGAAERLARSKEELVAVPPRQKKGGDENSFLGFLKSLNPLIALEGVCDALQRGISKASTFDSLQVQQQQEQQQQREASEKEDNFSSASSSRSSFPIFTEEEMFQMTPKNEDSAKKKSKEKESSTIASIFDPPPFLSSSSSPFEEATTPTPPLSPSNVGGMPALAHIPVRLALSLLRGASGRFMLLSGKADTTPNSRKNKNNKKNKSRRQRSNMKKGEQNTSGEADEQLNSEDPDTYGGADSLDTLQIYFLPKCDFIISSTAGDVRFTPGFLSEAALQKFYKKGMNAHLKGILAIRRLKRRLMCQNLRLAAAVVAGAGTGAGGDSPGGSGGGGFSGGGGDEDEEDDGFGDSPDIYEAIQEISEEIPGFPGASPTLGPSSSSLIRAGATLATGILTLIGPLIESIGDGMDSVAYVLLNKLDKNMYKLNTTSRPLGPLLSSFASYNAAQAAALSTKKLSSSQNASASASPDPATADTALALAGLCMAVGAKLAGDALSSGPTGIMSSFSSFRKIEQSSGDGGSSGTVSGLSMFGAPVGGGWASAAAAAAAAAAQSNGDSKETELTAILRSLLPSLEFNGFSEILPMNRNEKDLEAMAAMVGNVLLKETGRLGVSAEIDMNARPEQFLEEMKISAGTATSSEKKEDGEGGNEEKVRPTLGRGLVLIADPGRVLGLRTPRGFSLDGVGIPVGVDDGRRYL